MLGWTLCVWSKYYISVSEICGYSLDSLPQVCSTFSYCRDYAIKGGPHVGLRQCCNYSPFLSGCDVGGRNLQFCRDYVETGNSSIHGLRLSLMSYSSRADCDTGGVLDPPWVLHFTILCGG